MLNIQAEIWNYRTLNLPNQDSATKIELWTLQKSENSDARTGINPILIFTNEVFLWMIFSGFEISGMKNIQMPDDAKKNHLKRFEKTGRRGHHGLIKFDLRQKINQKRKKQLILRQNPNPITENDVSLFMEWIKRLGV